jgi:hypothetical protein
MRVRASWKRGADLSYRRTERAYIPRLVLLNSHPDFVLNDQGELMPFRFAAVLAFGIIAFHFATERAVAITNTHSIEGYSNVLSVAPGE